MATAEQLLGVAGQGVRHVYIDCNQTTVWPSNGAPGWTIEAGLDARDEVIYQHRATEQIADYSVLHSDGADIPTDWQTAAQTNTGEPAPLLQTIGNVAELFGYQVNGAEWMTLWRVVAATGEPLSIQAHLLNANGGVVAVADSLGYDSGQWQPGDRFIQRFDFGAATGAFLETGLYNYQTLEPLQPVLRLPASNVPQP